MLVIKVRNNKRNADVINATTYRSRCSIDDCSFDLINCNSLKMIMHNITLPDVHSVRHVIDTSVCEKFKGSYFRRTECSVSLQLQKYY